MNRRTALAAAATAIGMAVAGCDRPAPTSPDTRASSPTPTAPGPSPTATNGPSLGTLPPEVINGPRDRAAVALTYHGQGEPDLVHRLLAAVEETGARITVLAVGSWLDARPDLARRILDGGHELGNHTQNHLDIANMNAAKAFAEIDACAQVLTRLTGSIGRWFRPSQTQRSTALIMEQATRVGYQTCLSYDVDSLDYTDPGPEAIVRNTMATVTNGSIVSLHFGHDGTMAAMPALLDGLRQRGLRPVTVTDLLLGP